MYPFATVTGSATSISLAVPMGPQMQRFGYDTVNGLRSTWDLGLSAAATKTKSKASWTFWIYSSPPAWGFRAAAQKYYALNPSSFTSPVKLQGAWVIEGGKELSTIPTFKDFGWGVQEGDGLDDIDFANQNGIPVYHYIFPERVVLRLPDGTQPSYNTLIATLEQPGGQRDGDDGAERADRRDGAGDHQLLSLQQQRALHGSGQLLLLVQQHPSDLSGASRSRTFRRRACGAC